MKKFTDVVIFLFILCLTGITYAQTMSEQMYPAKLAIWAKAEDLVETTDNRGKVMTWSDARNNGLAFTSMEGFEPSFLLNGAEGTPSIYFGDFDNPENRVNNYFDVPLLGEYPGATIFMVGADMNKGGLIDTSAGGFGSLRHIGVLQITSSNNTAPGLNYFSQNPGKVGILSMSVNLQDDDSSKFDVHINGEHHSTTVDTRPSYVIMFKNSRIGNVNYHEQIFSGEIKEVLYYVGIMTEEQRKETEKYLINKYINLETDGAPYGVDTALTDHIVLPEVKAKPYTDGVSMWFRSDDIEGLNETGQIQNFPAVVGGEIVKGGGTDPQYFPRGIYDRPAIRFGTGSYFSNKTDYIELPGEFTSSSVTVAFVGAQTSSFPVFDTAPGQNGSLRVGNSVTINGSGLSLENPYPILEANSYYDTPQMLIVEVGIDEEGKQYIQTYANGHIQQRVTAANGVTPINFKNATAGNGLKGMIAEMMVFPKSLSGGDRAQIFEYFSEKYTIPILPEAEAKKVRTMWSTSLPRIDTYSFSWFGNTFSGKDDWVQSGISGINVFPDGTVMATSIWDERHKEIGFYKDGKVVGPLHTGGGFAKIVYDDKYIYVGKSGMGKTTCGIARYEISMDGESLKHVPFEYGEDNGNVVFDVHKIWIEARGLLLNGNEIYICVDEINTVFVYDKTSGQKLREFEVNESGSMAIDKDGFIWLGNSLGVFQYTIDGNLTGKQVAGITVPGITITNNNELVAIDKGIRQQAVFYDISGVQPVETKSIGQYGGVYGSDIRGVLTDECLYLPTGVAVDDSGNIYINNNGNMIRSFTPDGKLLWQVYSVVFCTASDFDPITDGKNIYGQTVNFKYDETATELGKEWEFYATSMDPYTYPELSRTHSHNVVIKEFNGEIYRYNLGDGVLIHKKLPGDSPLFAPVAYYNNGRDNPSTRLAAWDESKRRFAWTDFNGNNLVEADEFQYPDQTNLGIQFAIHIDDNGNLFEPRGREGFMMTPMTGFTESGAPIYDLEKAEFYARPKEFTDIFRACYFPKTDTMYLSGYTWEHQRSQHEDMWGTAGREVICYTDWSTQNKKIRSRMPYPDKAWDIIAIWVMDDADLLFATTGQSSVIFVYNTLSGELIGVLEPDYALLGTVGWVDTNAGIRGFQKEDGSILLIQEDSLSQREMIYHMKPIKTDL